MCTTKTKSGASQKVLQHCLQNVFSRSKCLACLWNVLQLIGCLFVRTFVCLFVYLFCLFVCLVGWLVVLFFCCFGLVWFVCWFGLFCFVLCCSVCCVCLSICLIVPQQRKLMGPSAQNSSGVHWCRPRVRFNEVLEKVPNVPEKVGAEPGQVQQGSREGSEEGLGGFGAEPGQVQRSRADLETKTADSETNRHADSETNGHAHSETQLRPDSETNVRKPKLTFGNLNLHDQSHLMHQVIK